MKFVFLAAALCLFTSGCGGGGGTNGVIAQGVSNDPSYIRLQMSGDPFPNATSVLINIQSVEVFVQKGIEQNMITIAQGTGMVNFSKFQNGVFEILDNLQLPPQTQITQMRVILGTGDSVTMASGSTCALNTAGAQQSGINISFSSPLVTGSDELDDVALDFQTNQSVAVENDGSCQFTPVMAISFITQGAVAAPAQPVSASNPPPYPTGGPMMIGPITNLQINGVSNGTFGLNADPSDPALMSSSQFWISTF